MYAIFNIIKTPTEEIPSTKDPDLSNVIQEMIHELGEENQTITDKSKTGSNSIR